jgi:hypothetical protein
MRPESVSPGAVYFSATWSSHSCAYLSLDAASMPSEDDLDKDNQRTRDIVWSPGGR